MTIYQNQPILVMRCSERYKYMFTWCVSSRTAALRVILAAGLLTLTLPVVWGVPSYSTYGSSQTETFVPDASILPLMGPYSPRARSGNGYVTIPLIRTVPTFGESTGTIGGDSANVVSDWPISNGTVYLYSGFASGTLAGYDYDSVASYNALRDAIWYFEGQIDQSEVEGNPFVDLAVVHFGSLQEAMATSENANVRVIELVPNGEGSGGVSAFDRDSSIYDKGALIYGKGPKEIPRQYGLLLTNPEYPFYGANPVYGGSVFGGFSASGSSSQTTNTVTNTQFVSVTNNPSAGLVPGTVKIPNESFPGGGRVRTPRSNGPTPTPRTPHGPTPPPKVPDTGSTLLLMALALGSLACGALVFRTAPRSQE